jgi:pimeloyl-ACP methyl ester carboxylesterase
VSAIHVRRIGVGPPVVLVHGAMTTSIDTWAKQEPLAARWELVIPDRRGYEPNPPADHSDFEVDAEDLAPLLGDGSHLVAHSYGAIGAMLAAARRPEAVRSLTLIEPPSHNLLRGNPDIEAHIAAHRDRLHGTPDPVEFMRTFLGMMGLPAGGVTAPLPPPVERRVRLLQNERPPWDKDLPIAALRAGGFPVLVVSGGHHPTFELLSDAVATAIGPTARRVVVPGRGHVVQRTGAPFNDALEDFLRAANEQ